MAPFLVATSQLRRARVLMLVLIAGELLCSATVTAQMSHAPAVQTPSRMRARKIIQTIPPVVGMSVNAAIDSLRWTELSIVQIPVVTRSDPAGVVLRQQPQAGTPVTRAKAETLFVATAPTKPRPGKTSSWDARPNPVFPPRDSTGLGEVYQNVTCLPDLTGRTPVMVADLLRKSGLRAGRTFRDYSDEIDSGRVFRQHPLPSCNIVTGTSVTLWYSNGPHKKPVTLTVPSVVGLNLGEAGDSLRRVKLRPGHVDSVMTRGGEGKVLRQLPHEGESAHPGDAVDLIITIAPAQVEVPSLFGMSRDNAEQTLQSAGLNIGRVAFVTDGTKTLGIISQKPPAKTFVDSATLVDVVENRPPQEDSTKVPDLIGKSLAQSDSALEQAGLVLGEVVRVGPDRPDEVTDQKPKAGTPVSAFSRVDIALGVKVPIVRLIVPDVVNLDVHSAQRVLRDSGFTQISIDSPGGDTITSQSIIESQLPAAGTQVPAPTPVALTVRKPPPPRLVPNLVGHRKNDARNIAQLDTFQMIVKSEVRRLRWRDEVVSQHPLAWSSRSTDNTIEVVAEVPVIPPLLVIGVIGFGAVAGTVWRIINPPTPPAPEPVTPQKTPEAPKPDIKLVKLTEPAGPPTLDTGGRSTLINAEYRLLFDVTTDPVRTAIPNDSIVKSTELRNV